MRHALAAIIFLYRSMRRMFGLPVLDLDKPNTVVTMYVKILEEHFKRSK